MTKEIEAFTGCFEGKFVRAWRPIRKLNEKTEEIENLQYSFVKLDCIKTIHEHLVHRDKCVFYTYKGEWYLCAIPAILLVDVINGVIHTKE